MICDMTSQLLEVICKGLQLTLQVSDEGHRFDGIARVGEGLDDMILHHTNHTESRLMTCRRQIHIQSILVTQTNTSANTLRSKMSFISRLLTGSAVLF